MRCEIITLFPDVIRAVVSASMLRRACDAGLLAVRVVDLRDYTVDRHRTADDVPYGGGAGMVLKVEPVAAAVEALRGDGAPRRWVLTSPRGRRFSHHAAVDLSREDRIITVFCGHYEGVDERIHGTAEWEELSIGDYVLTGGELAAMAMIDAASRLVPGVLGDPESAREESFVESLLEYPQYTRPAEFRGMRVPDVLLSGHHQAIARWRREQSLRTTHARRPDLFARAVMSEQERSMATSGAIGSSEDGAHATDDERSNIGVR
ncbi:MAG: tRNA (guanosine(37)-N1)-methyltransferase TrmD [Nitrospirota bacterium]